MSQPTYAAQQTAARGPGILVVTGGTDGIGRALAERRLGLGDTVVIIGRAREKGEAFLAHAREIGAADRARLLRADLGLVAENRRVLDELRGAFPVIDTLVFCARHYRSDRAETAEGVEETFAHFYLSRYLLGHGLADALGRSAHPVVVNVAGPGAGLDVIRWDDLEFRDGYHGGAALGQAGKLNDLLGVVSAERYADAGLRYVLVHPGATVTSLSGQYDEATRRHIEEMQRTAKPLAQALEPIAAVVDRPPRQPLSAFVEGRELDVRTGDFDAAAARRLDEVTEVVLKKVPA
ncbi:SDR family NAD(P)-dependent oxidoreductase [Streptomyces sp. NPDC102406]|uniref:SDR family NAD(P)-dependent oxidoreductase n=1 Tax=Streptomyces sp. NPDC102406 TaxID=3366171 RepID=UPI0037F71D4B